MSVDTPAATVRYPDAAGHFGRFGGRFVPEALVAALDELDGAWRTAIGDESFQTEFAALLRDYAGTPSLLYPARRLSAKIGAQVLLKREDLNHTGAHKVRNVLGQALLTKRMGKRRVIAETGAGQHGVATATAAALFDLECVVYMGEVDTQRQALNVARMRMLGATVVPVTTGSRTLKDAMNEAMRDWVANVDSTHYLIGTAAGPHPFPALVRDFVRGIGDEARQQCLDLVGKLPDAVTACVGGGSNALGVFHAFVDDPSVRLYGFEAGGDGPATGRHAASITGGSSGVLHGTRTYVLQDADGQTVESHSISAGLDYPGRRAGARLAARHRPGDVPAGERRRRDGRLRVALPYRGHHPRDRELPRVGRHGRDRPGTRRRTGPGAGRGGQPLRPWGQGRAHRRGVLRRPRQGVTA